jgi:hypothetical protein
LGRWFHLLINCRYWEYWQSQRFRNTEINIVGESLFNDGGRCETIFLRNFRDCSIRYIDNALHFMDVVVLFTQEAIGGVVSV